MRHARAAPSPHRRRPRAAQPGPLREDRRPRVARGSHPRGTRWRGRRREVEGLEIRGIDTMGGREVNDMYFTDCYVPADRLIGQQDQAWMQLMTGLNHERLIIAAQSLGMAQRAFDDVLAYIKERKQF